jgi:hypothetical protein
MWAGCGGYDGIGWKSKGLGRASVLNNRVGSDRPGVA